MRCVIGHISDVSSYYYIYMSPSSMRTHPEGSMRTHLCVLILLHIEMCPHTTTYIGHPYTHIVVWDVSSYYYICVLIPLYMCPHATIHVSSYYYTCVLIPLCMCPHTPIYVQSLGAALFLAFYLCPHTHTCAVYVSSYYICVLILLYMCAVVRGSSVFRLPVELYMCPHTAVNIYMCPHTPIYVCSRQGQQCVPPSCSQILPSQHTCHRRVGLLRRRYEA